MTRPARLANAALALLLMAGSAAGAAAAEPGAEPAPAVEATPDAPPVNAGAPHGFGGLRLPQAPPAAATDASARKAKTPAATGTAAAPYADRAQSDKSREFYRATWGIDDLHLRMTSSGNLIRLSFRVTDPRLAKPLGEAVNTAYLYAPRAQVLLEVPTMEKVGPLRQQTLSEANRDYWLVFSNKGNPVHVGDRADIVIGKFHATGLIID